MLTIMQNKHIMKVHQRRDLNAGCKHDDCEQYSESTEKGKHETN